MFAFFFRNFEFHFFWFWLLACSRSCLESCERLIGQISTKWRPNPSDPVRAMFKKPTKLGKPILRWNKIVPGGLITSPRNGPGGSGTGFCSPGGVFFSLSRRSGLPLRLLPLKPPPGLQKPVPGPPGPLGGLVIN